MKPVENEELYSLLTDVVQKEYEREKSELTILASQQPKNTNLLAKLKLYKSLHGIASQLVNHLSDRLEKDYQLCKTVFR